MSVKTSTAERAPAGTPTPVASADRGGRTWSPTRTSAGFSALPGPAVAAVVGLCYFGLAQYVIWLNDPVNAGAGYWPAAGLSLVALLLLPVRRWGWVVGAIVVAEIGGGAVHDYPLAATSWWALGNVAEPVVAALLLRRFGRSGRLTPLGSLVRFFVIGVVVGPLIGAAIGSIGTTTAYGTPLGDVFVKWMIGDGLGVLVVAPLLLCFREPSIPGRSRLEAVATVAGVVVVALFAFANWHPDWEVLLPYLVFPALIVASVRLGIRGAAIAGFLIAEIGNVSTALGSGPFRASVFPDLDAVTMFQVFMVSLLVAALVTAVLTHDAVDSATQHERQRAVADAFQTAALPERLPVVPGLDLAADYDPSSADDILRVGGDWYDIFALPNGSTGFVIGDVAGHDLSAAVLMMQVRNRFRSLLGQLNEPSTAMAAMDRQLATIPGLTLVTAIVAIYTDGELAWTSAGHPPPLIAPADGPARYLAQDPEMILGLGEGRYTTHRVDLGIDDVVVAYTDGVIEDRSRSLDGGFAHLARIVSTAGTRDAQALCDLILQQGLGGLHREDDACVVVIKRTTEVLASPILDEATLRTG